MRNMNYNVKRFTQPLKGICSCNYAAVKSIGNLVNDNIEYRQYNKGFFIRQLGEVMERIDHGEDHAIIEPVVPGQDLAEVYINETGPAGTQLTLDMDQEQIDQGMLIITAESTSNVVKNVTLVYPSNYNDAGLGTVMSLTNENYDDIFTTVPLTKAELEAMYDRAKNKYNPNNGWHGVMQFGEYITATSYDYKLYVYLFPKSS